MNRDNESYSGVSTIACPCIRHCCLDEEEICLGCFRTLDEILNWSAASNEEKQAILIRCQTRKSKRRGRALWSEKRNKDN
ncbi:DUF1289 domain-containing protein [Vibrio sp. TRT 29B02]|uniref:DUF1289 domain-containing protein n=1 Tax=Vibrio sp. TRT 29B02 TaxID=3418508 RepID=UPI003CE74ED2